MPVKLTKREFALSQLSNAPIEMEIAVPEKRVQSDGPHEWQLQAMCVKALRERMALTRSLRFMAAGAAQVKMMPRQAGFAKMCGYESGIADLILIWNRPLRFHIVELKLEKGKLTESQLSWFAYWAIAGVPCSRVDNIRDFNKILDGFCGGEK